jgi:tRNA-specific 2-thiouridylase
MSGGVDSSVTAYLLKNQGYEVEGVSFILYEARLKKTFTRCCSIEAINDAKRTAEHLGIKHTAIDLRDEFMEKVIEPFIEAYSQGITPNPCILCNKHIKFPYLLKTADEKGAEFIATGHYARVERSQESAPLERDFLTGSGVRSQESDETHMLINQHIGEKKCHSCPRLQPSGVNSSRNPETKELDSRLHGNDGLGEFSDEEKIFLKKGIDPKKDQSYVLYVLRQEELGRLKLPLGEKTKDKVREIAKRLNLPAAKRPESQEICFIEDKNYFKFLENLAEHNEGDVIDIETGNVLGRHKGVHLYTIGQRKRLGIATGRPLFVAKIDPSKNAVYVGPRESAMIKEFVVEDVNWLIKSAEEQKSRRAEVQKCGSAEAESQKNLLLVTRYSLPPFRASVKVRSMMKDEPASISIIDNNTVRIIYDEPQWAPAPGQSAVFYDGDIVIGGGVISA